MNTNRQTTADVDKSEKANKENKNTTKSISQMDEDDIKRLHSKCRKLLERCIFVMEGIDMSPTEHIISERQLFRAAVHQRHSLGQSFSTRDILHDSAMMKFTPKHMIAPCAKSLDAFWSSRKVYQSYSSSWAVYMNNHHIFQHMSVDHSAQVKGVNGTKKSLSKKWYRNKQENSIMQVGEPFDLSMHSVRHQMKREEWNEYIVNAFVDQNILEHLGIELLVDENKGYLFYCPIRKEYSSNGRFRPFPKSSSPKRNLPLASSANNSNSVPTTHDWSQRIHQNRLQKVMKNASHANVWKRFDLSGCLLDAHANDFGRSTAVSSKLFGSTSATNGRLTSNDNRQQISASLDQYRSSFRTQRKSMKSTPTPSNASSKRLSFAKIEGDEEIETSGFKPSDWAKKDEKLPYNPDNLAILQDAFAIADQDFTTLKYSSSADYTAFRLYDPTVMTNNKNLDDTFMTSFGGWNAFDDAKGETEDIMVQQQVVKVLSFNYYFFY